MDKKILEVGYDYFERVKISDRAPLDFIGGQCEIYAYPIALWPRTSLKG